MVVKPISSSPFAVGALSSKLAKEARSLVFPFVVDGIFDVDADEEADSSSLDIFG